MKEFIEKLIGRLEELKKDVVDNKCPVEKNSRECEMEYACETCYLTKTINIVNELAEEYNNTLTDTSTTNADRIRSMTDEELAEFFEKLEVVCDMCAFKVGCCNIVSGNCKSGLLKWLQSEVEGVTENE